MADPGTLIPTDNPSAKDTAFKPYNPNLINNPAFHSYINEDVTYSGPKPLQGEGSSQNSEAESSLAPERRPISEKVESLSTFSGTSTDPGVGSSRTNRPTQLDHLSSSAFENSLYRGSRGAHAVDGVTRMNVNVVPYTQNNAEDPKNLFADLNPFQIKGPVKASMYNKPVENKVEELQRPRNNIASGRPPASLMWKNKYAFNEVPKKKENDNYMEGIFPRINREPNGYSPSSAASTSSTLSEQINPGGFKSTAHSNMSDRDGDAQNVKGAQPRVTDYLQNDTVDVKEHQNNEMGVHDPRRFMYDRFMETNLKLKDPESSSSSFDSISSRVEQVFDDVDVSESEIPWEDLVLGERIGLGNVNT